MDVAALAAFAAAFLFFAASSGPDNVTIVARTVAQGALSGIAYGAGTCTGIKLWTAEPVVPALAPQRHGSVLGAYLTGVVLNLGNPKMPLFYIALLPHVVGTQLTISDGGTLAAVILAVEIVVVGGHVVLASRARRALRNPVIIRRVNRTAGTVMIGAGAAVAVAR